MDGAPGERTRKAHAWGSTMSRVLFPTVGEDAGFDELLDDDSCLHRDRELQVVSSMYGWVAGTEDKTSGQFRIQ